MLRADQFSGPGNTRRLVVFFILATALAWVVWVPALLATYGLPGYQLPAYGLLGALAPGVAALVAAGVLDGRAGLGALLTRVRIWRVGLRWYAVALLLRLLIALAAFFGYGLVTGRPLAGSGLDWSAVLVVALIQVPNTLFEEIGWRGYAMPRLMPATPSALTAGRLLGLSLPLGLFWVVWHLPYWLSSSLTREFGWPFLVMAGTAVVSTTVLFTWLYVHTRGSVLVAWLFHLAINVTSVTIPVSPAATGSLAPQTLETGLLVLVAAAVAAFVRLRQPRIPG